MGNKEILEKEFDLRERRLNLMYKVLYVIVAIWLFLFYSYASNIGSSTFLFSTLLSIVTTTIFNILLFVFDELRCMKISRQADEELKNMAEDKYGDIWDGITISSLFPILFLIISCFITSVNGIKVILFVSYILSILVLVIGCFIKDKKIKFIAKTFATSLICFSTFSLIQIT